MLPAYTPHAITLLSCASLILAKPLTNLQLARRSLLPRTNPCQPGGNPILYDKEYHADLCPPALVMSADGSCPTQFQDCTSYCEVRQTFTYAQEVPLDQPYCHGPLTCSISSNKATSYTFTGSISAPNWLKALGLGITGGYSTSTTTTDVRTTSVNLAQGQCGYFTFLPIMHDSWYVDAIYKKKCLSWSVKLATNVTVHSGTLSEGSPLDVPLNHCINIKTTGNVCSQQPFRSADGKFVQGDTIFVHTDCGTRARLPANQQDPAYNHDGVAAPQSVYDTFSTAYDCTLSPECQQSSGAGINPSCTCTCAGKPAPIDSPGCGGFQGALPDPPTNSPPNGP